MNTKNKTKNLAFFIKFNKKPLSKTKNLRLPEPKNYHVLVKIIYSGFCGSQIKEIDGERGKDIYIPHLLGHEGYAKVVKVGKKVKSIKVNDYVLLSWIKSKGGEEKNIKIKNKNIFINSGPVSTFSTFSLISENRCTKIYQLKNVKFSPVLGCSLPTGLGLIIKNLRPKKNKTFILSGIGGVGIFAFLAIKLFNPKNVIIIEKSNRKILKLNALNLDAKIIKFNSNTNILKKNILSKNNNKLADYIIDCSGNIQSMNNCINFIKKNGIFLFASHPSSSKKLSIYPHELISGKKILGSWGGGINLQRDKSTLINFYNNVFLKSNLKKMIKIFPLKKINQAINCVKKGHAFKVLLKH